MRKVIARILIRLAVRLLARKYERGAAAHIRNTVKIADFPKQMADALIARGVAPNQADVLFRDCLRRPEC